MAHTKKAERCEDSRRETRTWLMHTAVETSRVADNNIVNIMSHLKTHLCLPAHWFLLHRRFWSRFKAFCKMSNQLVFCSAVSHGLFVSSCFAPKTRWSRWILLMFRFGGKAGEILKGTKVIFFAFDKFKVSDFSFLTSLRFEISTCDQFMVCTFSSEKPFTCWTFILSTSITFRATYDHLHASTFNPVNLSGAISFDWQIGWRFKRTFFPFALTHIFIWFPSRASLSLFLRLKSWSLANFLHSLATSKKNTRNRIFISFCSISHRIVSFVLFCGFLSPFYRPQKNWRYFVSEREMCAKRAGRREKNVKIRFTFDMIVCRRARPWWGGDLRPV